MSALSPFALVVAVAAATPALPATLKTYGCSMPTHSAKGLYEVVLDEACDSAECVALCSAVGAVVDATVHVTHTSDSAKIIRTQIAGAADDTVAFSVAFFRMPGGH